MKTLIIIKILIILSIFIFAFLKIRKDSTPISISPTATDFFTLYKKTEKQVQVARAVTIEGIDFDLYLYEIDTSLPEDAKQSLLSVQRLNKEEAEKKKDELLKTYNWTPFKGQDVLFVQIQPEGFRNEIELLNK